MPVSAAEGTHEGIADPQHVPQRHADFSTWQPPEEEGDDEPILGAAGPEALAPGRRPPRERPRRAPQEAVSSPTPRAPAQPGPAAMAEPEAVEAEADADFAEIYVNVGRRDGARAADFQHLLTERAGLDRAHVRRIRVRERNAFVSVRRDDLARALAALSGASIAGKVAMAEQARERGAGEGEVTPAPVDATPSTDAASPRLEDARERPPTTPSGEEATEPSDEAVPTGRSGT